MKFYKRRLVSTEIFFTGFGGEGVVEGGRERKSFWGRGVGVGKHFNLPGRFWKSMITYSIPFHQSNSENRKEIQDLNHNL